MALVGFKQDIIVQNNGQFYVFRVNLQKFSNQQKVYAVKQPVWNFQESCIFGNNLRCARALRIYFYTCRMSP